MSKGFFGTKGNEPNGNEPLHNKASFPTTNLGAIVGIIIIIVFVIVKVFFT